MLKLPPPIWALAYVLIAVGISYLAGWPQVRGFLVFHSSCSPLRSLSLASRWSLERLRLGKL